MVADAISQKLGADIVVLDTRGYCSFADYFVIGTSESSRQTDAIAQEVARVVREQGERILAREGDGTGWLLIDLGDVVVHVFGPAEREFYQLEQLWEKAPVILRIQ